MNPALRKGAELVKGQIGYKIIGGGATLVSKLNLSSILLLLFVGYLLLYNALPPNSVAYNCKLSVGHEFEGLSYIVLG